MARTRNIKPGFFNNDTLAEVEPLGRLLFAGLWTIADRDGRLEDRPKRIKATVLPYDNCDVNKLLAELARLRFIVRYVVDGERFIQVANWDKHQQPHVKEADSTIPPPSNKEEAPDEHHTSTVLVPGLNGNSTEQESPHPLTLNLILDSGVGGVGGADAPATPRKKKSLPTPVPEDFEITPDMHAWFKGHRFVFDISLETENFLSWCGANGRTYVNHIKAWQNWMIRESKSVRRPTNGTQASIGGRPAPNQETYKDELRLREEAMARRQQAPGRNAHN